MLLALVQFVLAGEIKKKMSFKYQVEKHTDNHYVLPKMKDMKCDVHAFLSEKLYDWSEEEMWTQAANSASYEGVTGVYLMSDCHLGYSIPVGGVVVTNDVIIQSGSGFDISCGMICMKVKNTHAQDVASWEKRDAFVREASKRIAFGTGSKRPAKMPEFDSKEINDMLHFGAKAIGSPEESCERQYIPIEHDINVDSIEKAYEKASPQMGSVGSGNHYVELQVNDNDGSVYVMVHCGSRGYGYQTASHFFYKGAELRGLPKNQREKSWLYADEPLGKEYWAYHNAAANYAIANRHVIINSVQEALRKVWKTEGEVYYEISHNLVQQETILLPDGTTKKGFVHRKGATRAFPKGHPDLVGSKWEQTGHPCIVAGSMLHGGAILFPKDSSKSGCSVNHGSGRRMGRNAANKKLEHKREYLTNQMKNIKRKLGGVEIRGIVTNNKKLPLDECGEVYKDLDEVLKVLEDENIAKVDKRLYPVANLKGA